MQRLLLTWSDRGVDGPMPAHHADRPSLDRGPVLRLLDQPESRGRYSRAIVLTVPQGHARAELLAREMAMPEGVEVREISLTDPSDYAALFAELGPLASALMRRFPRDRWEIDILLSAGTPQAQTLWVILVQASLLHARLLQIIPAAFVPNPHPKALREVTFDISGFPEIRALRAEVTRLRSENKLRSPFVAQSDGMKSFLRRSARVASSELPVLILGETGTGKELVARAIHEGSERKNAPFVAENCAALAESVLASELFGHESGAFSGATARHRGLFEQAHGGTLFLDEIGELPLSVQAMLLRVLQEGTVRRVGGEKRVPVDVRIVAATHRNLGTMVAQGSFREDLYYRLRGATLTVPALRDRIADIPELVSLFLEEVSQQKRPQSLRRKTQDRIFVSGDILRQLTQYRWPGNVRELRSEVHRWAIFCDEQVTREDLAPEIGGVSGGADVGKNARLSEAPASHDPSDGTVRPLADVVQEAEQRAIEAAFRVHHGNLLQTAKSLGIERNTLKRKLVKMGRR